MVNKCVKRPLFPWLEPWLSKAWPDSASKITARSRGFKSLLRWTWDIPQTGTMQKLSADDGGYTVIWLTNTITSNLMISYDVLGVSWFDWTCGAQKATMSKTRLGQKLKPVTMALIDHDDTLGHLNLDTENHHVYKGIIVNHLFLCDLYQSKTVTQIAGWVINGFGSFQQFLEFWIWLWPGHWL